MLNKSSRYEGIYGHPVYIAMGNPVYDWNSILSDEREREKKKNLYFFTLRGKKDWLREGRGQGVERGSKKREKRGKIPRVKTFSSKIPEQR